MTAGTVLAGATASWRAGLRKVLVFRGRAGLAEYWWCFAIVVGAVYPLQALVRSFGQERLANFVALLALLLVPVSVRRLHDVNRSAWSMFVGFIPILGGIFMLVWLVSNGTPGLNRYGPSTTLTGEAAYAVTPQTPRAKRRVHVDAEGNVIHQGD
jgi:uncharacterized membrane protein YhaH (DUF805 family)